MDLSGRHCGKPIKTPYIIYYSIINTEEILVVLKMSFNNCLSLLHTAFPEVCQETYMKVSIITPDTSVLSLVQLHFIFNNVNDSLDGPLFIFTGNAQDKEKVRNLRNRIFILNNPDKLKKTKDCIHE